MIQLGIDSFATVLASPASGAAMSPAARLQNLLAEMLGVQRPTITNAARELERAGSIRRGRRQIKILNRQRLMKASCECYQLIRARTAFHLPKTYARDR